MQRTYVRGFVGNHIKFAGPLEFIAETEVAKITAAKLRDATQEQVDGFRLDLTNGQVLYTLSLRTFTIQDIEGEVERSNRLGREALENPIT